MGRLLKRVPLDFKWPINQAWKGFINPFNSIECKSCDGSGFNKETKQLSDDWYDFEHTGNRWCDKLTEIEIEELVKEGRISDCMPFWYRFDNETGKWMVLKERGKGNKWEETERPEMPTVQTVNAWARRGMGHDAINRIICIEARAKSLGVYGHCEYCGGEGVIWQSEEIKKLYEEWEAFEPPVGEGFQLWEDTSEGSPQSPVFTNLEELCGWCQYNATTFGSEKASKESWMKMLNDNLVCHQDGNIVFM